MKTKKLLATFALISVVLFAGCKKDKYLPLAVTCPEVASTIPANNAVGILQNQVISATFNEAMNPVTINASSFTLTATMNIAGTKDALVPIEGVVTYSNKTASFTPSTPLVANTTYFGRVTTAAKNPIGNSIKEDFVWKFNTGVAPKVISTDPPNLATGVILNKAVSVAFNIPLDPLTLIAANVTLKQGTNVIAGAIAYSGTTLTFTPASAFMPNTVYTGTITTGVKSVSGMPMASDYIWNFNTGISPIVISTDPVNLVTGVVLNNLSSI